MSRDPIDEFCLASMVEEFEEAATFLSNNGDLHLSDVQKLRFYALFKQATVGKCTVKRPGLLSFVARAKWDAWKMLDTMSQDEAVTEYISALARIAPQWKDEQLAMPLDIETENKKREAREAAGRGDASRMTMTPALSRPIVNDAELANCDKTVHDWASEGNRMQLVDAIRGGIPADSRDKNGLTPLHWAADRGHTELVTLLVSQYGASIDGKDNDGNTPLHCAVMAEQTDCVQSLLGLGASCEIRNEDGELASELVDGVEDIARLFSGCAGGKKTN